MSGIKTLILTAALTICWAAPGYANKPLSQVFAECVGRFSAETEHAWLMRTPQARDFETQRLVFLSLLDATVPSGQARQFLAYRIEVKMAHASLLTLATFGQNPERATQARHLARHHVAACQNLLLDS